MMAKLASLGLFVFDASTFPFSELGRRQDWRFGAAPRLGDRDATQYLGPGDDLVTLTGAIVPEAGARYGSIATLTTMADQGEAYPFVDGSGVVWGSFVILSLDQRRRALLVDGVPRMIDFTVELRRVA